MSKRHIYVVDDEEPIRRSTRLMLTVQGYDVAVFESGRALIEVAGALKPGTVLLDIRMPGLDGLEVQRELAVKGSAHSIIVMTGHGDLGVAISALQAGAIAFLEKPFSRPALDQALTSAFRKLEEPEAFESDRAAARAAVLDLPEGERAVLQALALGLSNEAIAAELGLPAQTVDARRTRLFAQLGVETLPDALTMALAAGMGPPISEAN